MQEDRNGIARAASTNDVAPEFRINEPPNTQNPAAEDNNKSILTRLSSTSRRGTGRSRKGCLTCKRRKVKCGEQRPCCSSCEHLNLECKWNPLPNSTNHRQSRRQSSARSVAAPTSCSAATATLHCFEPQAAAKAQGHAVDEVFDYASFMWDSGEFWPQENPPAAAAPATPTQGSLVSLDPVPEATTDLAMTTGSPPCPPGLQPTPAVPHHATPAEHRLLDIFARSNNPPLLAEVETQSQWNAMRQVVLNMALVSEMIRYAILAFANSVLVSGQGSWDTASRAYYDSALAELSALDSTNLLIYITHREHVVVTLFFIAYVDILESQLEAAHTHLSRAYAIFQPHASRNHGLSSIEKQFFLWFRVLDGRTVSSGGDGSFLSSDEILYMEPSPTSLDGAVDDGSSSDDAAEGNLEDVLFSVLYQPGITFYQKVLRFNERISKIDPWHRPRGTVGDEMEVMNIAAVIAKDLRLLYEQRPQLLDFAVSGKLTGPQISPQLAMAITRSFRTYLSNYYSSKVHLHRVAFNTLPLTREVTSALENIRLLARQLVDGLPGEPLPVNMLWPLLMLGVEESSRDERAWIREQMLRMEHVAGNARITAQVLQEVQSRQDASKGRVDIRLVMVDVFNSSFAFV